MLHRSLMVGPRVPVIAAFAGIGTACSPAAPSTECKGLPQSKAVALAVEHKQSMLERSVRSERDNFATDVPEVAKDSTSYVAKVRFKGIDGRTLIALIDEDCYAGWMTAVPAN